MDRALLLHFEEDRASAERIANACGIGTARIERHRFPDGEIKLRLPVPLVQQAVLLRSLNDPNEKLIELLLAAQGARTLGATKLVLVAPYLAYMRQDAAFQPGEVVSQRVIGDFLATLFDAVVTVDPHLHRIDRLDQAIPVPHAVALSGAPLLAALIRSHHAHPLLIGPDVESRQWIEAAASAHGFEFDVCRKLRHGDRSVDIELPTRDVHGRTVVLLDDVASSGQTLAVAAQHLLAAGASSVDVAVTHALFADEALQLIRDAGVWEIWSTDCIPHPSNAVSMAPAIAEALRTLLNQD